MPWWSWVVVGAVCLAAEVILSTDFFLVFFGASALIVGALGLARVSLPIWSQWLLFAGIAVVSLTLFRSRWRRSLWRGRAPYDELRGEIAVAGERLAPGATGRGQLRGTLWQMRNAGPEDLEPGDRCRVEAVEGLTLTVRKAT
jgi:membrane protein implicated in regulation of membrane protease activity